MRLFAVILLSALLCVQPVNAMSVRDPILYADTAEEAGTTREEQSGDIAVPDTEAGTQEEAADPEETVGQEEAAGPEEGAAETQGGIDVSAPSAVLMESSTGQIIYEKDADTQRPPASVTKVMTLLLIFDALESGKIKLEDEVTTSEYAASMGGSQVFLEPGEVQTVETMIKCISVASANDACVSFKDRRPCMREAAADPSFAAASLSFMTKP